MLHTSFTLSHTSHSFYNLHLPFFAIHSIPIFRFTSVTLFVVSSDISLSFSLSLSVSISCLFNSFVSFFHTPLIVRRHIFSLIVVIFIACRCLILFARNVFGIDVTKGGIDLQRLKNVTPGCSYLASSYEKPYSSLGEEAKLFVVRVSRGKMEEHLHVPSIRVSRSDVVHKCGHRRALHDVAKLCKLRTTVRA